MRSSLVLCLASASLLVSAPALAQPAVELAPVSDGASLLRSIETESHAATTLYVTSVVELIASPVMLLLGLVMDFGCVADSFRGSYASASRCESADALYVTGFVLAGLGVLTLPVAIGLDVDAGSRMGGLDLRLGVDPATSSGTVSFSGIF